MSANDVSVFHFYGSVTFLSKFIIVGDSNTKHFLKNAFPEPNF